MKFSFLIGDDFYSSQCDLESAVLNIVSIFPTVFATMVRNSQTFQYCLLFSFLPILLPQNLGPHCSIFSLCPALYPEAIIVHVDNAALCVIEVAFGSTGDLLGGGRGTSELNSLRLSIHCPSRFSTMKFSHKDGNRGSYQYLVGEAGGAKCFAGHRTTLDKKIFPFPCQLPLLRKASEFSLKQLAECLSMSYTIEVISSTLQWNLGALDQTSDISHVCLINEYPVSWSIQYMPRPGRTLIMCYFIQSSQRYFDNGTIITQIFQVKQLRPKQLLQEFALDHPDD